MNPRLYRFYHEQSVGYPLERVFPFFEKPENLAILTPPHLGFRVLTPGPVQMAQGRIIDYCIRVFGLSTRWRTIITTYDPPNIFIDEQLKGPFSFWSHRHLFIANGADTLLQDDVHYMLPVALPAPFTHWLNRFYVKPRLENIFGYRRVRCHEWLGGGTHAF